MAHPVFYKGEQAGKKRYYDERLAMFLLRYRDLYRYGARDDRQSFKQDSSDEPFSLFNLALNQLTEIAAHDEMGALRTVRRPLATGRHRVDAADVLNLSEHLDGETERRAARRAEDERQRRAMWGDLRDGEEPN